MKIEFINIDKLVPNENNPRTINDSKFQKLVESVKKFPEMLEIRPIVINADNIILGGNMRYQACLEAGIKKVPVMKVTLTDEQEAEFIIKDNVSGGEWDYDKLANEWDVPELLSWGLEVSFNEPQSNLFDTTGDAAQPDDAEVPMPNITDNGYVRFEIVMLEEDKKVLMKKINKVKDTENVTIQEAFNIIFKAYEAGE